MLRSRLIGLHDRPWSSILDQASHDFYHLPSYTQLAAAQEGGDRSGRAPMTPRRKGGTPFRVWIFNHYAITPDRPGGSRHYELARELVRRGWEVTIFAAGFDQGTRRDDRMRDGALVRSQLVDGVRFVWLRTFPYRGNTWRRMVNMATYAVLAPLAQIGRPAPDVVIGSTVHPFAALAAWFIAVTRRARFIYEIRDLWPQTLIDIGAIQARSPVARGLAAIESWLVHRAEIVISLLPGVPTYLDEHKLPSRHVRYLPNGADLVAFDRPHTTRPVALDPIAPLLGNLAQRRAAGEVVFAYVGAHGRVNGLDIVLRAFRHASDSSDRKMGLLLVGDGPEKRRLQWLTADLGLTNVVFADPIAKDRVPELLAGVDVGIVHATATPVYRYGVSFNKVFDYMAASLPIAFACVTANDPVRATGAGRSVAPDDPAGLGDAFLALASLSAVERRQMGRAGRRFVEREHSMSVLGERFVRILTDAVSDGGPHKPDQPEFATRRSGE